MGTPRDRLLQLTELRYQTLPILLNTMLTGQSRGHGHVGDVVTWVLRCHLLSEAVMDRLLQIALAPNGDAVLAGNLSYPQKLNIVSRCVLIDDIPLIEDWVVGSLRKLHRIRNRMAHELGATVTIDEAIDLFAGIDHPVPPNADVALLLYHF